MKAEPKVLTVRLLLFAQLREALGGKERALEIEQGDTPRQVLHSIAAGNDRLEALEPSVRFLVNGEFVSGDEPLRDGDELAFVPPVAGG